MMRSLTAEKKDRIEVVRTNYVSRVNAEVEAQYAELRTLKNLQLLVLREMECMQESQ